MSYKNDVRLYSGFLKLKLYEIQGFIINIIIITNKMKELEVLLLEENRYTLVNSAVTLRVLNYIECGVS